MNAPTSDRYELYRVVTDMEGLHEAFRDRVEDMNVSRESIDEAGKFTARYSAKLLCDPPVKWLGRGTLHKMLKATGMAIVLVVDDERFAPVKATLTQRKRQMRANAGTARPTWLFTKEKAREMGKKRWSTMTPAKRTRLAKRAAKARWAKQRGGGALLKSAERASCAHDDPKATIT